MSIVYAQKPRKVEVIATFDIRNSLGLQVFASETRTGADKQESKVIAGDSARLLTLNEILRIFANDKDIITHFVDSWFYVDGSGIDKKGRFEVVPQTGEIRPAGQNVDKDTLTVAAKPGKRAISVGVVRTNEGYVIEINGDTWEGTYAPVVVAKRTVTEGTMELFAGEAAAFRQMPAKSDGRSGFVRN